MLSKLLGLALLVAWGGCQPKPEESPGQKRESSAELQKRLEQDYQDHPGDAKAKEELVMFLQRQGVNFEIKKQPGEAEQFYRRALELDPKNAHTHFLLGNLLIRSQRYEDGIQELNNVVSLNPTYSDKLYELLGQAYAATGQADKAKDAYLKHLTLSPASLSSYRALAKLYRDQGLAQEAAQSETLAEDIARWGYPDRGYQSKSLEEWLQDAQSGHGRGMGEGLGAAGSEAGLAEGEGIVHRGPGAKRRALALYNVATYYDRAINDKDIGSFEKANKSWKEYKTFAKGLPEEKAYEKVVKSHLEELKLRKKGLMKAQDLMPAEEVLGKTRQLNQSLQQMPMALAKLEKKTQGSEGEAGRKVAELKSRLSALDLASYQRRLQEVNHAAVKLMNRKLQGDPGLTKADFSREAQALYERGRTIHAELKEAGFFDIEIEIRALAAQFQMKIPKHSGGEEEDGESE
ncbi:MAG: hypothetical protein A2V67_07545 [Deltaproteobacteria bacterium RBG_13_61_14]|nr:MAG: hypothetical protein A2V67_07545 [Deltaproteobacteria bacterium RBG_13_61_14]